VNGADRLQELGYRWNGTRWVLVDPDSKPKSRPGLCKACRKFNGHPDWDGLCAGCMWFGPGDPHGLDRSGLGKAIDEAAS
jgi:hypothetical protein